MYNGNKWTFTPSTLEHSSTTTLPLASYTEKEIDRENQLKRTSLPRQPHCLSTLLNITPGNHHLYTPDIDRPLQHILEIVLMRLFPVVDPAVNGVGEVDADLVEGGWGG